MNRKLFVTAGLFVAAAGVAVVAEQSSRSPAGGERDLEPRIVLLERAVVDLGNRIDRVERRVQSLERRPVGGRATAASAGPSATGQAVEEPVDGWEALKEGLTKGQVRDMLGSPQSTIVVSSAKASYEAWRYPERGAVYFLEGKVSGWREY